MLENFDFKFEQQYQTSHRKARQQLEEAIATPGNDGWDYFLLAGILGIESIHTMRHEEYAKALSRGYEAIKAVRKCSAAAPEFIDIELGDGLFDYWATVISRTSKMLPDLEDKREQGIEKMLRVEQRSLFLQPPATLALTFTWIEEGKRAEALESALKNHQKYPKNIINALVLGRVYGYNRKFAEAERIFKEVQAIDPKNQRSHYYLARLYMRQAKHDKALAAMDQYLAFENLGEAHRSYALYYKGQVYFRKKDYAQARTWWEASYKVDKNKRAKKRIEKLDEQGR
jgi:tetratricopeptide (TPR) repeat protein